MFSEERRSKILNLLELRGSISVNDLADRFQSSRETIRRDLADLERQGFIKRTHGGAIFGGVSFGSAPESPIGEREILQKEEKTAICRAAASLLRDGDTIFVDNSSTMNYLPGFIPPDMSLTIVTNSINFLLEASRVQRHNWLMICLGGIFKAGNLSVHGADTLKCAEPYYPSKAFFSCAGISPLNRVADSSLHEIEIKQMMIERAQEAFLLADHTKFSRPGQMFLCDFPSVDRVVTTRPAREAADTLTLLEEAGVAVIFAE